MTKLEGYGTLRRYLFLISSLSAVGGLTVARAAVEFEPSITVGVAHTDNLELRLVDVEAETVYQFIPRFRLSQESTRFTTEVAYDVEANYYRGRSDSNIYNLFDGNTSIALDPENFFLNFGASRSQSIRDPNLEIPQSNLPITSNRVERDEIFFGPNFQYAIGADVSVEAAYQRSQIHYDDDPSFVGAGTFVEDYDLDTVSFSIDNYRRERGFSWAMRYLGRKTDYGSQFIPFEFRQATAEVGGWIGTVRLFGAGGKESSWDNPFDPSLADSFWEVGIAKNVGERLSAEFAAGERTFGSSRRASVELETERSSLSLSYSEQPTTEEGDPYKRVGLLAINQPVDLLARPGRAERYISERFQWNWSIQMRRTTVELLTFDEDLTRRKLFDGSDLPDERQRGLNLSVNWQAGQKTKFVFEVEKAERDLSETSDHTLETQLLGVVYGLGPRTDVALNYQHSEEDSADSSEFGVAYSANLVSVLLTRTF